MKKLRTTKDGKHEVYRLNKKEVREADYLAKFFLIYEALIKAEEEQGKYVIINYLEKKVLKSKENKRLKISKKEFRKLLDILLSAGIVFYPRGEIVQRLFTFKWKDVKSNVKAEKYEKTKHL